MSLNMEYERPYQRNTPMNIRIVNDFVVICCIPESTPF